VSEAFGDHILLLRRKANLSQLELANVIGVSRERIAAIEGHRILVVRPELLHRLAIALGTDELDLLYAMGYLRDISDTTDRPINHVSVIMFRLNNALNKFSQVRRERCLNVASAFVDFLLTLENCRDVPDRACFKARHLRAHPRCTEEPPK
jgi:transcriptional regulator with XRE-family HTH domain